MESAQNSQPSNFLLDQLHAVVTMLDKQRLEKNLIEKGPSINIELVETLLEKQHNNRLRKKFAQLHPADIAFILESLPLNDRKIVWDAIKSSQDGQVLLEVSDAVRQTLISGMEEEDLANVAGKLDTDEIADIAADIPKKAMLKILRSLNSEKRRDLSTAMAFPEHQVGALMDFGMITIRDDLTLKAVVTYIRKLGKLPRHTDKLFVVDQQNIVKGVLPIHRLLTHQPSELVAEAMVTEFIQFQANQDTADASRAFERYDLISAPVVDDQGGLLGRLCVDDIIDFIREENDEDMLIQAGVAEEEDLFSSIWKSAKNRWSWLIVNIFTAFITTRIIGLFEDVILQLVALASLTPIIAATGGNTGNQTSMLIIRSLAMGQISSINVRRLIRKELCLAALNGALFGLLVGLAVLLLYQNFALASIMALAMFINLLFAVSMGLAIPLLRHKYGKDPALGTSVMLTSMTDAMGFFIFLGLASVLLLN